MHTKIIHFCYRFTPRQWRLRFALAVGLLLSLLMVCLPGLVAAATQAYKTQDATITKGMAVALAASPVGATDGAVYVEKSSVGRANKTLGVVVDPTTDTVAVTDNGSHIYVATSGTALVYVTDLNDPVRKGDLLAASPLTGVLMRAVEGTKGILGAAAEDFPQTTQTVSVDEGGGTTKTKVGLLKINMDVKFTTNTPNVGKSLLQRFGEAIVHHQVSTVQVLVAIIILLLLLVVEGGIVYGAVSSAIVSLGRNPLAKGTIMKGLGEVTALVAVILGLGLAAVYLVMWI